MSGAEWVRLALEALVLLGAVGVILGNSKKLGSKIDALAEVLTGVRLDLKSCVTWDDLSRELGPVREDLKVHEKRLTTMEAKCEEHHK